MIKYLFKFSTQFSELVEPIRELSKEKVPFTWDPEYQSPVCISSDEKGDCQYPGTSLLQTKEAIIQTDASIKGLGECLLQDEKSI